MTAPPISTDIPTPDPVRESPPHDRFCDLILNGGVASGIVYPWALVELARDYRFHSIGGNSVGAMAAALAAAAEYGRCQGQANAFEVLRRAPLDLAKEEDGQTKMLRLFQPSPGVRRLFALVLLGVRLGNRVGAAGLVARLHRCWIHVQALFEVISLYGLLTLLVGLHYAPSNLFRIPAGCFFPAPDVESGCLTLTRRTPPLLDAAQTKRFVRVVKRAFSQRRKMMFKLLKAEWPEEPLRAAFAQLGISPQERAEKVGLEVFIKLCKLLAE